MTTPMMPSAPPVRATAPSRSESRDGRDGDSAAPFAAALDGAMADDSPTARVPSRDAGRHLGRDAADQPGRRMARGREDGTPSAGPRAPGVPHRREAAPADRASDGTDPSAPADAPPPAGVPAGLWALLLAAASSAPPSTPTAPVATSDTAPTPPVSVVPALPVVDATPDLAATLLAAPGTDPTVPPGPALPVDPSTPAGSPTVPGLPQPASPAVVAAPVPTAPVAQSVLPGAPPAGGGDPAAAFAALAASAGATVTAVTAGAPPATPAPPRTTAAPDPAADVPDSGIPAGVPLDGPAGGPAAVPVTGGQSSGAGNPGQDGGSSDSSPDRVPDLSGLTPATPTPPIATAAVAEAAPAAPPAPAPPVSGQLAQHIAVLRGADDGEHSMTLILTPERLGPVEVQVSISKGALDLSLRGAHEQGRAALLEALPDLRRDLESAGLTCSRLEVDRTTGGAFTATPVTSASSSQSAGLGHAGSQLSQQQTPGQRGGQQDWSDGRFRSGLRTADSGDEHSVPSSTRSTSAGVDVRV